MSGHAIARSTEHQGGGNQVFQGEGVVAVVQQAEEVNVKEFSQNEHVNANVYELSLRAVQFYVVKTLCLLTLCNFVL